MQSHTAQAYSNSVALNSNQTHPDPIIHFSISQGKLVWARCHARAAVLLLAVH